MFLGLIRLQKGPTTVLRRSSSVLSVPRSRFSTFPLSYRPKFELRPYQQECISSCIQELESGSRRIAVSLPTGAGKTVIFTHLIDEVEPRIGQGDKTMILVHRRELAFQAAETCKRAYPEKIVEVEMGSSVATENADIVIASVQTLVRGRTENFNPEDFKMVIIDECHHAAADSYIQVLDHFGITAPESKVALVGFSATLRREDDKVLANTFDKIVFHLSLEQLIFDRHLVDAKFTTITLSNADLGKVKSARGDFVISGLAAAVNNDQNNEIVLGTYLHFVKAHNIKSAMLFGINIDHVESLCRIFRSRGVNAEYVTSKTKKDRRASIIEDFKAGNISVLMNCGIFTEGTDMPNIDCILLARPTRSKTLLVQMIGRGLRLHASKEFCHIVDFVGINNSSVVTVPSLRNLPVEYQAQGLSFQEMDEEKLKLDAAEEEKKRKEEAKVKEEELAREALQLESEEMIQNKLDSFVRPEFAATRSMDDLELTTFDSISDFVNSSYGMEKDFVQVMMSKYPWVRGPTRNIWILNCIDKKNSHSHYRLEKHPSGLRDTFLEDVEVQEIYYVPKKLTELKDTVYTLSRFTERAGFRNRRTFYENRWAAELCAPISANIKDQLLYIENLFLHKSRSTHVDYSKFAAWRSAAPTAKQLEVFMKLTSNILSDTEKSSLEANLPKLTRGVVSDTLFGFSVFRNKGLKPAIPKKFLRPSTGQAPEKEFLEEVQSLR